jgi:hypothetical protein
MPHGAPGGRLSGNDRPPPGARRSRLRGEPVNTPQGGLTMRKLTLVAALAAMLAIATAGAAAAHPFDPDEGRWRT